jgi:type VI secretion system (T6SS) effector TldE1-like protein
LRDGYDPAVGRYTQSDPIGLVASLNTYSYVDGDPIHYSDSAGLARCLYQISTHSLSCTPNSGSIPNKNLVPPTTITEDIWSGVGACQNNTSKQCIAMEDIGPVPPRTYRMNLDTRPHEYKDFWRLEPIPKIPGWKCSLPFFGERCGFLLHPGTQSKGCITVDRTKPEALAAYKAVNDLLRSEVGDNFLTVVP